MEIFRFDETATLWSNISSKIYSISFLVQAANVTQIKRISNIIPNLSTLLADLNKEQGKNTDGLDENTSSQGKNNDGKKDAIKFTDEQVKLITELNERQVEFGKTDEELTRLKIEREIWYIYSEKFKN